VGRVLLVLAGAGLYGLALPPFDCSCLAWLTLVPLLVAVRARPVRQAFAYGVLYGCAFGWVVTGWAAQAAARYFALGFPVATVALSVFYLLVSVPTFGLFAAGAAALLGDGREDGGRLAVPALWVATELVRGRLVGQPWGLLGYTQHAHAGLIQVAAVTGVYGVSFLLASGNLAVAEVIERFRAGHSRTALLPLVPTSLLLGAVWLGGATVVARGPVGGFTARPVAIVQTNIAPAFHWSQFYADREVLAHAQATADLPAGFHPALVVWPENAVPRYLEGEPTLAAQLGELAAGRGADLLFGAPRYEDGRTYNSVRLITAAGRDGGHYDKQRLVLLAEASPLTSTVSAEPDESPRQFSAGTGPGILRSFLPLGVSICHEILFPEIVGSAVRAGAELLVNVSNDGWLDGSRGIASRQHFAMAAFRAVEARRYLVRAATTGVSGVIDPYGRVVDSLGPGAAGLIRTSVAGRDTITPYVRLGDAFAFGCMLLAASALYRRRRVGFGVRPFVLAPGRISRGAA